MLEIIDIDPSFFRYINNQRAKMLELIVKGVNNLDELSYRMFIGKNTVKRHAKLLENLGILRIRSSSVELNITPRNLALLLALNIISLSHFFILLKKYIVSNLDRKCRIYEDDVVLHFLSDGGILVETNYKLDENSKVKIAERLLKNVGFIYVSFKENRR